MTFKIERARRGGIANEEEGGTRNNSGIRKSELRKKKKIELFFVKIQNNQPKSKKEYYSLLTQNIDKYSITIIRICKS